jgi:hypothetical protein
MKTLKERFDEEGMSSGGGEPGVATVPEPSRDEGMPGLAAGLAFPSEGANSASRPRLPVKWKALPRPSSLSTQIRPHEPDQLRRDGQPQPVPAMLAGRRVIAWRSRNGR